MVAFQSSSLRHVTTLAPYYKYNTCVAQFTTYEHHSRPLTASEQQPTRPQHSCLFILLNDRSAIWHGITGGYSLNGIVFRVY